MTHRPRVTVYTRAGCGLCREAEAVVADVAAADADVEHIDIDADPALTDRYTVRVPVIAVDGEELFEYVVDPAGLLAAVRAAARR
ncbi:MAG TPA: glutaredoxin family protein [Egibacteraceae bacterium]|nr:glutaredoxin family protein [Egibacteraceae bacterium]